MNKAIKCYSSTLALLLLFFFIHTSQSFAQSTRSLQWSATTGATTVSVDELCPASEGYIEFIPMHQLTIGVSDKDNPSAFTDLNYNMYPYVTPFYTNLYFYKDGVYLGFIKISGPPQASDRMRIERKGSLLKYYYNTTLTWTFDLNPNQFYRATTFNYGSIPVSSMAAIATHSLIEPCSNYKPGSAYPIPSAAADPNINWVHNKIFNEHGNVIGETRVYLDNLGTAVQTQTKNYVNSQVIGKQLVYDGQGRNSLISMSAPTGHDHIQYQSSFLKSSATGLAYDYTDFDQAATKDNPSTVASDPNSVGHYYSDQGETYIPTTSYPFSNVQYHLDGSVRKMSNVGEHYRMGSGNETYYFYAQSGGELAHLYGYGKSYEVEVPSNDPLHPIPLDIDKNIHAFKSITIGPDDVEHVTFYDGMGKVLATAVSGKRAESNCAKQIARHPLEYRGTQSTKIHLPAENKSTLKIIYGNGYFVPTDPLAYIDIHIVDLTTDQVLVEGTDFVLSLGSNNQLNVDFLGTHATGSGFYRIAYDYTQTYLEKYDDFYIPGYEPPVIVKYKLDYSDWTLNYYDQRGRRVQTIQPKGVRCDFVDLSQLGNHPIGRSFDIFTSSPLTYRTANETLETVNTPALQNGFGQEVNMNVKTLLKPGVIVDRWIDNDNVVYNPIAEVIELQVEDNPFATSSNPLGDIVLADLTDSEFEAAYQAVAVQDIDGGNINAIPPASPPTTRNNNTNDIPWYCNNGYLDYGEIGIDCGGNCPDCEDCDQDPEFLVAFKFQIEFRGMRADGTSVVLGNGNIYRIMGMNCNSSLVDLSEDAQIQIDQFVSREDIVSNNIQSLKAVLVSTSVQETPAGTYVPFTVSNQLHRFVRYVYMRVDGMREVFFDQPIPHTMAETIVYDDLDRVVATHDNDRGLVEYLYDDEDKLRFTQDARQWGKKYFTYLSYDARGRVVETGEYRGVNTHYFPTTLRPVATGPEIINLYTIRNQLDGLPTSNRADQSIMAYDEQASNFPTTGGVGYEAAFVEGRVAMTKNDQHTTWYQYDHKGQVTAALQEYPELGLKTMDYEYDYFGRLNKSIYQKGDNTERFDHIYSYDLNGNLKNIETKEGDALPKLHAVYEFYQLGHLKRTELGEDLQGIDYTYTIDGELKAINHPSNTIHDPGKDGYAGTHLGFAKDVFSMALDYHSLDYVRKNTFINYGLNDSATDVLDGRIKGVRWNTRGGVAAPTGEQHMFAYSYDWKQQLNSATYGYYSPNGLTNDANGFGGHTSPAYGTFAPGINDAYQVQ
ncbi:MAG: hypothetical protein AAFP19_00900, partial [Bacteroidota bacterium]